MQIQDSNFPFEFDPPMQYGCSILCPDCGVYSPATDWRDTEVYCESCGDHSAIECPKCYSVFDHVYAKPFKVIL